MAISDKTRKILWGRSGNRCAVCRRPLVIEPTDVSDDSVVGEECHIVAQGSSGPRSDHSVSSKMRDDAENLILLCRVHHKLVDDQHETYTVGVLRKLKESHERWVETKLTDEEQIAPSKIRRFKAQFPKTLPRAAIGQDILDVSGSCQGYYLNCREDLSEDDNERVGQFFQLVRDYSELWDALEPVERMRAYRAVTLELQELEKRGLGAYCAIEKMRLEGGVGAPSAWRVLHLNVTTFESVAAQNAVAQMKQDMAVTDDRPDSGSSPSGEHKPPAK